jgi:hypothetical protein
MIKTKFSTESLSRVIELLIEFEDKLTMWSEENINATWDIEITIGHYEYNIIVTVSDEEDTDSN